MIVQVRAEVEKGTSLSAALARHPKTFNRLYVSMVRAGEIGGFLDQVLVKAAEPFEEEVELRGKIRSAMTYPVVVSIMVVGIVAATLIFIVPTFENLYESLGGTLPLPTRMLMGASGVLRRFFLIVLLVVAGLVFLSRRWKATDRGRYQWDRSGVPILQALEIVGDTVNNSTTWSSPGRFATSRTRSARARASPPPSPSTPPSRPWSSR